MKYIGFYGTENNIRSCSLAAVNKMNYISTALGDSGYSTEIIVAGMEAPTAQEKTTEQIGRTAIAYFFKSYGRSSNKLKRIYNVLKSRFLLFLYCLKNIKKDEQVIVYHSLELMRTIYFAKLFKGFKMILEVEEIYNDVKMRSFFSKNMELRFINSADKYIFPTELLNEKCNPKSKPYILIHGTYQVDQDRNVRFNDDKTHVVYAGTFDPRKGGSISAIKAAQFLDSRYHLHVIGFGSEVDKNNLLKHIDEASKQSECKITFDGCLSGEEYIRFLQCCDIGLSTQNPNAAFNATSFPSKILSYMANGLRVVSVNIPAIEGSAIGEYMYYYNSQTPEEIANAIKTVPFNDSYDGREIIKRLNEVFVNEIKKLVEE